jgi:hypothetical protein
MCGSFSKSLLNVVEHYARSLGSELTTDLEADALTGAGDYRYLILKGLHDGACSKVLRHI